MADRTAAQILVDALVDDWGVRHIFSLPGDGINGIYEALRQRQDDVQLIQVRHEETAAFAACAYSKFTGGLGVCLATSGPGAIHLLNGLYDAKLDGASVLAITGQIYHDLIGTFYQQEVNLIGLFSDVAVYNHEVRSPAQVEALIHEAVKASLAHQGVAHISFPTDLQEKPGPGKKVQKGLDAKKPMGHVGATWTPPARRSAGGARRGCPNPERGKESRDAGREGCPQGFPRGDGDLPPPERPHCARLPRKSGGANRVREPHGRGGSARRSTRAARTGAVRHPADRRVITPVHGLLPDTR
jgi:hypothetical protein